MKKILFILLLCALSLYADDKDILKRMPKDFDFVVKLNIEKLLLVKDLQQSMLKSDEFKDMQKKLKDKLGLTENDIESCYISGSSLPLFEMAENGKWSPDADNIETGIFVKLKKKVDFVQLKKEFPHVFSDIKEVEGFKCIKINERQNPHVAFLEEKLIMVCPERILKKMLTTKAESSLLMKQDVVNQLMKNGFGGVFSMFHCGEFSIVPKQTPWLKDYNGASINVFYDEKKGVDVELTVGFDKLSSAKNASLLINFGMGFMEMEPQLKQFKQMIKFRSYKKDLLLDVKVSLFMINSIIKTMIREQGEQREIHRKEWQEKREERRLQEEKKKAEEENPTEPVEPNDAEEFENDK